MLMAREQPAAARKAYLRLHGSKADVDLALSKIQAVLDHEKEQKASGSSTSFAECFMGSDRRRSFIVILVALLQYFLGVSLLANANYFLIMAGMSPTQSLQISQIGIGVQIGCICIASVTMTYFGRRVIVLCSCAATGVVFIGQGAAGFFQHNTSALRQVCPLDLYGADLALFPDSSASLSFLSVQSLPSVLVLLGQFVSVNCHLSVSGRSHPLLVS